LVVVGYHELAVPLEVQHHHKVQRRSLQVAMVDLGLLMPLQDKLLQAEEATVSNQTSLARIITTAVAVVVE
jgi:hypothetical protein